MEMLTYSLWFTLVWWVLSVISTTNYGGNRIYYKDIIPHLVAIPSIAILLEYLIVR